MKNIQSKLIDYIKDNTGTSFVEIEKYLMKMILIIKVKEHIPVQKNSNIVFWYGWNERAFDAVSELVNDGVIEMSKCESMIYIVDGKSLNFPILKSDDVDTYHWLPVTFNICKKELEFV